MSLFHMNSVQKYDTANQLRSHLGAYLLMFETLLRLNNDAQQAYEAQEYEVEYQIFEKNTRILVGMRSLFKQQRSPAETAMFDFFSGVLNTAFSFPDYDDRNVYYRELQHQISEVYALWKINKPTQETISSTG